MKQKVLRLIGYLFLIGGIGIIITVYFVLLRDKQEERLFYLNLVVTCLAYGALFLRGFDLLGPIERVGRSSASYGILWASTRLYLLLSLGCVICSIYFEWIFKWCLVIQIIFVLLMLLGLYIAAIVNNNVERAGQRVERRGSCLQQINQQLRVLEVKCQQAGTPQYLEQVSQLKEAMKYVTPSDNALARDLEAQLYDQLSLVRSRLEQGWGDAQDTIAERLRNCLELAQQRKKQY